MKKKIVALMLALGMTFGITAAAEEVTVAVTKEEVLEARIAALEARVAELEALIGMIISEETVTEAEVEVVTEVITEAENEAEATVEVPEGFTLFEEPYTAEIGIGTVMRETPELNGKGIRKLRVGTELTVLGGSEEWMIVEYDEEAGYVKSEVLKAE